MTAEWWMALKALIAILCVGWLGYRVGYYRGVTDSYEAFKRFK